MVLKSLIPTATGLLAVSSIAVGGGYSWWKNQNTTVYVLVKKSTQPNSSGTNSSTEYHCLWNKTKDDNCKVLQIAFNEKKFIQSSALKSGTPLEQYSAVAAALTNTGSTTPSKDHFLIKTKLKYAQSIATTKTVSVSNEKTLTDSSTGGAQDTSKSKNFTSLGYFYEDGSFSEKSKFVVAKYEKTDGLPESASNTQAYKCYFDNGSDSDAQDCQVCEISEKVGTEINFSSVTFPAANGASNPLNQAKEDETLFLIKLHENHALRKQDIKNKKIVYVAEETATDNKKLIKLAKFSIESLFLNLNESNAPREVITLE